MLKSKSIFVRKATYTVGNKVYKTLGWAARAASISMLPITFENGEYTPFRSPVDRVDTLFSEKLDGYHTNRYFDYSS